MKYATKKYSNNSALLLSKHAETFRAEPGFAGDSRRPNENLPRIAEQEQGHLHKEKCVCRI